MQSHADIDCVKHAVAERTEQDWMLITFDEKFKSNHLLNYAFNLKSHGGVVAVAAAAAKVLRIHRYSLHVTIFDYMAAQLFR